LEWVEGIMATKNIAIACQGGGSHAAFTAGALPTLMTQFDNVRATQAGAELTSEPVPLLVGLSGTSGGAISALLGWYGFITGGPAEAQRKLNDFWARNSTLLPGEYWSNVLLGETARYFSYFADVKYSPYTAPLQPMEWYFTRIWPRMAPPGNPFMRPDYFQLDQLLAPCLEFGLVEALGAFASIPCDVSRWKERELAASVYPPGSPSQMEYRKEQACLTQRISDHLAAAGAVQQWIDKLGLPEDSLLRVAFGRWTEPLVRFDIDCLARLSSAVKEVTRYIPTLLIGAVELRYGEFTTFSSECAPDSGGVTLDAVMASAALPWLVRAKRVRSVDPATGEEKWRSYWDGLFSQNPPIKNFMTGLTDERKKPDKLWIIQISPNEAAAQPGRRRDFPDRFLEAGAIWEVRNSLAGNISLNQEVSFVESINRRVATGEDAGEDDKRVQIDRIVLDGDAVARVSGMSLGSNSKMDRSDRLKDGLLEHGYRQANRFLTLRSDLGRLFGTIETMLAAVPQGEVPAPGATVVRGTVWVEQLVLHRVLGRQPNSPQAKIRWRADDAQVNGRPVRIEGEGDLYSEGSSDTNWQLEDVRITCIEPLDGEAAAQPSAPARAAPARIAIPPFRTVPQTGAPPHERRKAQ
jgi:predicted acylesterase/phospholipase RssA